MNRLDLYNEIKAAFNLDDEQSRAACVLLEARAGSLDYTLDEYVSRYHPRGVAQRDDALDARFSGYTEFLGEDAAAVLRAGKGADFSVFVHECAHAFRRQLTGDLREQAERAWSIQDGTWSVEKEEDFARGLERFIDKRRHKNELKKSLYTKGVTFVDTIYRGIEHIVDIDPRMEAVYERLFENNQYRFDRDEYEKTLAAVAGGKLPEESHVFLGMTPRIYEELGFERLPMAITGKHLYSTMRESGIFNDTEVNYHDLGDDFYKQIPEQIKKPLLVIQSENEEDEIISIIELRDKRNRPVILPVAQLQQGNIHDAKVDINLVKSIYGKNDFTRWLDNAIRDGRLLYEDKKRTGREPDENLITLSGNPSIKVPRKQYPDSQDVSGFYLKNIARYREAVKRKFPERFRGGERRLYHRRGGAGAGQIPLDFGEPADRPPRAAPERSASPTKEVSPDSEQGRALIENARKIAEPLFRLSPEELKEIAELQGSLSDDELRRWMDDRLRAKEAPEQSAGAESPDPAPAAIIPPLPNTPENLLENFAAVAGGFKNDRVEAARHLLRLMPKDSREAALADLRGKGCDTPEATRAFLLAALEGRGAGRGGAAATRREFAAFGAWTSFDERLSPEERLAFNRKAAGVIEKAEGGAALTPEEYDTLRRYSGFGGTGQEGERGVLYDYYTSPPVADLTWRLLEKCGGLPEGARVLEPSCGTGVFFETAPAGRNITFTGVELDGRTAAAARLLHGRGGAEIINQSFEAFNLSARRGGFDAVVGNAPFGERGANTAALDMTGERSLDNYFVSRSIDNLREGGVMALIVAPGVLGNKSNEKFRMETIRKAQFAGAVKLPDSSFRHSHTRVQPDILLFRKYPGDVAERLKALSEDEFKAGAFYDESFVSPEGSYFDDFPGHVLGEVSRGTGQWGGDEVKGDISQENIFALLERFQTVPPHLESEFETLRSMYPPAEPDGPEAGYAWLSDEELGKIQRGELRQGAVKTTYDGVFILDDTHTWQLAANNKTLTGKISLVQNLSKDISAIRSLMQNEAEHNLITEVQNEAMQRLEAYKSVHGNYPADDADLKRFTRDNPAVSGIYESLITPEDPLLREKNLYRKTVEFVDGHNAAISALLELSRQLKPGTEENIRAAFENNADALLLEMRINPDIFITPEGEWQLREDFISGDAWDKTTELRGAAETETETWKKEKLLYGAAEIEKAAGWTPIEEAAFSPRSSWIDESIVRAWAAGKDGLDADGMGRLAKNQTGKWGEMKNGGWAEMNDPLVYYLNDQKQRSRYYDTETFKKEHDDLFRSYIASHGEFRERLENEYNRKFKNHVAAPVKTYPVRIEGWRGAEAGGKTLKGHQWQSVHHLYRQGAGISALGTGFGKTATAVGLISLMRQEGRTNRVWLQVPNNKVKDWITEIRDVMPGLKIASIDPEEPGYSNRARRYAKYQTMASGGADVIVMPESAASEIQLGAENDRRVSDRIAFQYGLEKTREGGTARAVELAGMKGERQALAGKTNRTISFEDFGCDALVVDEAHNYKNLFTSSLSRETGLNDGRQSARAMSLYKKSEYVREQNDNKNVFLLTATPLTNSPLEYYNMLQYVAPEELRRMGVQTIDGFIREFADIETGWLYDWGRGQAKEGRILTGFKNLPTLQNLFFKYTDLQNDSEAIGLEKPGAENVPNVVKADGRQTGAVREISALLEEYKAMTSEERRESFPGENFLTFYTKMRTASLDLELYDPETFKGWKNPKLEALAGNARGDFLKTGGGQVVFCDRVFSSDGSFDMHGKIKAALVGKGFKEKEIVIVNGFTKSGGKMSDGAVEKEVSKAIADYNAGKYKVIIGSTACIGEGVNLQRNSAAVHHFDIPFRPSDFIQRNGRVDRQGNEQEKVSLNTYLASGTIDNYSVDLVQRKAGWIDQLLRTKSNVFTNPDDENTVDPDELLLALTEEWGDREAAAERRAEMGRVRDEKIREAQAQKMNASLKSLSLARGSLASMEGGEHTKPYRTRLDQIRGIESALKNNPAFARADILGSTEPFLVNTGTGDIYRKGDLVVTPAGNFGVAGFNFKKQEILCKEIPDGGRRETRAFAVAKLNADGSGWSHDRLLHHVEKAGAKEIDRVLACDNESFYGLGQEDKERHYPLHLTLCRDRHTDAAPLVFSVTEEGKLGVEPLSRWGGLPDAPLNPFSQKDQERIARAAEAGIDYYKNGGEAMLGTLRERHPEIAGCVGKAVALEEKRELEKERERENQRRAAERRKAIADAVAGRVPTEKNIAAAGIAPARKEPVKTRRAGR